MVNHIQSIISPDGHLSLEFCPEIGGCVTSFRQQMNEKTVDLFRPYDPALKLLPGNTSSFPMTPFTNRISHGKLHFQNEIYNVGPLFGEEDNALHGDGWTSPWVVTQLGDHHAELALEISDNPLSPYKYKATQGFTLSDNALEMRISVTNCAAHALPFGIGHHPYFNRTPHTVFKSDMPKVWLCDGGMVPDKLMDVPEKWNFKNGKLISDKELGPPQQGFRNLDLIDNCFTGWNQSAEIFYPETNTRIKISADPIFKYFVMYVPLEKNFFVAEPVTNIIDAFNLDNQGCPDTGTTVLQPDEKISGRIRFEI